jgi:hypothetical protein
VKLLNYFAVEHMVDENVLEEKLAEELLEGWQVVPTGSGFLVTTAWRWPTGEMIEIYVRNVAEREDLYVVTDGGELFNFLFARGIDLRQDDRNMKLLQSIAASSGAGMIDYQIVKGANNDDLPRSIRLLVEAVKEGAFLLWHLTTDH